MLRYAFVIVVATSFTSDVIAEDKTPPKEESKEPCSKMSPCEDKGDKKEEEAKEPCSTMAPCKK